MTAPGATDASTIEPPALAALGVEGSCRGELAPRPDGRGSAEFSELMGRSSIVDYTRAVRSFANGTIDLAAGAILNG